MSFDSFGQNGLTTQTFTDLVNNITASMEGIYGNDIIVTPNSPDGQMINMLAQVGIDVRELITEVNAGFDPDQAQGVVLDQRLAINNIQRKGGTYTIVPITIVTTQTVALLGLDANYNKPLGTEYTIQDAAGNKYILINSVTLSAGTTTVNFRAASIGAVFPIANSITIPATVILGITSITNSSGIISAGTNQETDASAKIRRIQSLAIGSFGYLNGLIGALNNLTGVVKAKVYENRTSVTNAFGIPGHSIWCIVDGGSSADIANAIYSKIGYGCNMKGSQTYQISTVNGSIFTAQWDVPSALNLYIKFKIQTTIVGTSFNQTLIKQYMANNLIYNIGDYAETSSITAIAKAAIDLYGGGGVPVEVQISTDNINWFDYLTVSTLDQQFTISTTNISITVI